MGCFERQKGYYSYQCFSTKMLDKSNHKPNKIWVDKGSEVYNWSIKSCWKIMILKYIQNIMMKNLLLWCGLLVPWRMKPTKKWLQFKKMCILIN